MYWFVNKEQLPVISTYYVCEIFVMLLLALGFRMNPRKRTFFRPSCADVKKMQRTHAIPLQVWTGPEGSRRLRFPDTIDSRYMKVVRLSALRTGRLYTPGNIPGTHFCYRLSRPLGHSAVVRIMLMKNFKDTIGNRTRDLPACSTVPQPTAPLRRG